MTPFPGAIGSWLLIWQQGNRSKAGHSMSGLACGRFTLLSSSKRWCFRMTKISGAAGGAGPDAPMHAQQGVHGSVDVSSGLFLALCALTCELDLQFSYLIALKASLPSLLG